MKKNLKKAVSLALASVMAFSLAACSGGSGSGTTTAAQADGKEAGSGTGDVTIKFCWWGGDSRHEATEKAVDAFMAKYPDIKVECEYGAWTGWEEKQSLVQCSTKGRLSFANRAGSPSSIIFTPEASSAISVQKEIAHGSDRIGKTNQSRP